MRYIGLAILSSQYLHSLHNVKDTDSSNEKLTPYFPIASTAIELSLNVLANSFLASQLSTQFSCGGCHGPL